MGKSFFELAFPDVLFKSEGNTMVCCPFPHYTESGLEYYETNASMGIDIEKGVYNCFGCNRAGSETSFAASLLNISYNDASILLNILKKPVETQKTWEIAQRNLWENSPDTLKICHDLGFTDKVLKELNVGYDRKRIAFPVIMFGQILDVAGYMPNAKPKVLRRRESTSGLINPYDLWVNNPKNTIICAGEKDMAICRSKTGFNAITITGGEGAIPTLLLSQFQNRKVYIVYDNDEPGRNGARRLAMYLKKYAKKVYVVDISETCVNKGEDVWDYFMKYNKTKQDFVKLLKSTPEFTEEDYKIEKEKETPMLSISEACHPKYIGKTVRSNVQVVAVIENQFALPVVITATKEKVGSNEKLNTMELGAHRSWILNNTNLSDIFYLIDNSLKEDVIKQNIKTRLLKIPPKEEGVKIIEEAKETVYRSLVTDVVTGENDNIVPQEMTAYSLGTKLENGKKYCITYSIVPNPQDGQKLVMVITDVEESDDFINNFKITDNKKQLLSLFQPSSDQTDEQKFFDTISRIKGLVNADYDMTLLTVIDLVYNSVLSFTVGKMELVGCLDVLVVAESRVGKSTTVEALHRAYKVGKTIPLAGSSATVAGIIGGSSKVGNNYQTRIGVIPQNHKGLIVFEELVKSKTDILKELTDIRTSHIVRIARVNGTIEFPAKVRKITLTNTKASGSTPKPISSYPNGIEIIIDLVGTAEDIARFDMMAVLAYKADKPIDPFYEPPTPYSDEAYQTRVRWVWSRKPENVQIPQDIYQYTVQVCNQLNQEFDSYIKIFGIEAWKKVLKVAIAIACSLVSTDETFENVIVKKEHIDIAVKFLRSLYDNPTFRFKEYVEEEKRYRTIDSESVELLQELYQKNPTLLLELEKTSSTSNKNLQIMCGDKEEFNSMLHVLVANRFIRLDQSEIYPTERFRKGMAKINRTLGIKPTRKKGIISF